MKRVTVTVPKTTKDKWLVSIQGLVQGRHRRTSYTSLALIEQKLPRLAREEKVSILVKMPDGTSNETKSSQNVHYLLHTLSCFLEDYLSTKVLNRMERLHLAKAQNA